MLENKFYLESLWAIGVRGILYFLWRNNPPVGQGILFIETSRSHSVGVLWASDQPDPDTCYWQHTALTRDRYHAPAGFEPAIPASERLQTDALDLAATGIGSVSAY
jgi:hypothetical protein